MVRVNSWLVKLVFLVDNDSWWWLQCPNVLHIIQIGIKFKRLGLNLREFNITKAHNYVHIQQFWTYPKFLNNGVLCCAVVCDNFIDTNLMINFSFKFILWGYLRYLYIHTVLNLVSVGFIQISKFVRKKWYLKVSQKEILPQQFRPPC